MVIVLGPYLVACALLVVAGGAKVARPADTARALGAALAPTAGRRIDLDRLSLAVRLLAAVEAALGAAAAAWPRPALAAAVAASYAAFAAWVTYLRRRGGALASCGCFGTPDTPATRLHLLINAALTGVALAVAADTPGATLPQALAHQPLGGAPLLGAAALATWLTIMAMSGLARLQAIRIRWTPPPSPQGGQS